MLGNKGNELSVHLLACMTNLKVVVMTKIGFWSTVMDCDVFSADAVLVYLGKSSFRDITPIPSKPTTIPVDDEVNKHEEPQLLTQIDESQDPWVM